MKTRLLLAGLATAFCALSPKSSASSEPETYATIRSGDRAAVEKLLSQGVSPSERDANGNTLLMRATIYGKPELLSYLIGKGADVNAANKAGATALMRAASDPAKVELLVEKGANVNARSALGNTALILAARAYPSYEAVKTLIDRGAEVNATNNFGANAIIAASAAGDIQTVRLLWKHGADVNSHSRGSETNVLWGGGRSPLMWASARGDLALMKVLLDAGATVNEPEGFGTALIQAAWMNQVEAAKLLLKHGADVHARDVRSGYTALHWAASSDRNDSKLVDLLIQHGADPNSEGGQEVDAFLGIPRSPLMLAQKRGDTAITRSLTAVHGKVNPTTERPLARGQREVANGFDAEMLRLALKSSVPPLERTAVESKQSFVNHASKQQCVSCHQQYLPMTATAYARRAGAPLNAAAEEQMLTMVQQDNGGLEELTAEATFHPEPAHGYGYALFALGAQEQPADSRIDAIVHHLLVIQGKDGQWHNNLPRPPIQTSDVAPTALAIKALKTYGFPARQKEIHARVERARNWLAKVHAENTEELTYQIMGLVWAGENPRKLKRLTAELIAQQKADGGWAQLAGLETDAYATGQALFALHAAGISTESAEYQKGLGYLVKTQLADGTWHIARRAFPFQPTMPSGFPHGRDSWISASATSWATMAISLALQNSPVQHVTASK
jgi:ankyrin repeat protein